MNCEETFHLLEIARKVKLCAQRGVDYEAIQPLDKNLDLSVLDCIYYPGSFDPPTHAHNDILKSAIEQSKAPVGYFVIGTDHTEGKPCDPIQIAHRVMMLADLCAKDRRLGVMVVPTSRFCNLIWRMRPTYSDARSAKHQFPMFITGMDVLPQVIKNNSADAIGVIMRQGKWLVVNRDGIKLPRKLEKYVKCNKQFGIHPLNGIYSDISSTQARKAIEMLVNTSDYINSEICSYAVRNNLYD